jgi:hypothetical protein
MSYALAVGGGMAALGMASSFLGSMGSNQQAAAAAMQQQMARENAEFQRRWTVDANNRNILKNNLAKAISNRQLETLAITDRGIAEVYGEMGYDNAKSQYSKQTSQINSALLSSVSSRGMSASSGTARALLRQNISNAHTNMANLRITQTSKNRDIVTAYNNTLAKRDFNYTELQTFLAGDTSTVNAQTSTGMMIAQASITGLTAGLQGYAMAGGFNKAPPPPSGGIGGMPPPAPMPPPSNWGTF